MGWDVIGGWVYLLVLGAVLLGHLEPAFDVLLKGWVHDDLLGDGVACELPDELILPPHLVVLAFAVLDVVVELLQLLVVVLDAVGHARCDWHAGAELAWSVGFGGLEADGGCEEGASVCADEGLFDWMGEGGR
jgi:hypothetical protein